MDENEKLQAQLQLLVNVNRERAAEIMGLHLIIEALVRSHPDQSAFRKSLDAQHQKWLAHAMPSGWSETELKLVSKPALAYLKR